MRLSPWTISALIFAIGTFAMGTDLFVLAGIVPQLSAGLHIPAAAAGQVISVFALTYAVGAPLLSTATASFARRPLLVGALVLFAAANLAAACAPTLALLLVARIVAAIGAALFTPTASACAAMLAGPAHRGRALAIVLGGLTIGTVLGVPVGTLIGQHWGWPASLVFVAAVALLAVIPVMTRALSAPPPAVPLRARVAVLADPRVALVVGVTTLSTASGILVYTYIAPILAASVHVSDHALAIALLIWGLGGTVGAFASGWLADRYGANRTLLVAILMTAASLWLLGLARAAWQIAPLMATFGAAGWAITTPNNHRLTAIVPAQPAVVISFNASGTYLGQAIGALGGGALLGAHVPPVDLCSAGALIALLALALQLVSMREAPIAAPNSAPSP
jgi:predicted MFS family arabinose efflux permease